MDIENIEVSLSNNGVTQNQVKTTSGQEMTPAKLAAYQEQICRKYFKKFGYNDPVCKAEIQVFISAYLASMEKSPTPSDFLAIEKGLKQLPSVMAKKPA